MKEGTLTRRIALCLVGILLCFAVAFTALSMPARAATSADGTFTEDFENYPGETLVKGGHSAPYNSEYTLIRHKDLVFNAETKIKDDPTIKNPEQGGETGGGIDTPEQGGETGGGIDNPDAPPTVAANKVLQIGGSKHNENGANAACGDYFATRTFAGVKDYFTLSADYYFPTNFKDGEELHIIPFTAAATPVNQSKTYMIKGQEGKTQIVQGSGTTFTPVTLPIGQWFTLTCAFQFSTTRAKRLIDIYYTPRGGVPVPVAVNIAYNKSALGNDGLAFFRIASVFGAVAEDSEDTPTYIYMDNISARHELVTYASALPPVEHFRFIHAALLEKTEETLLRSDWTELNEAVAEYEKMDEGDKSRLTDEIAKITQLLNIYETNPKFARGVAENFDASDVGYQFPYASGNLYSTDAETTFRSRTDGTRAAEGEKVIIDPLDDEFENQVYMMGGIKGESVAAKALREDGIYSRSTECAYFEKFTIKVSLCIPQVLKEGEEIRLHLYSSSTGASTSKAIRIMPMAESDAEDPQKTMNALCYYGMGTDGSSVFTTPVPTNQWFDVVFEWDYVGNRSGIYLVDGEDITFVMARGIGKSVAIEKTGFCQFGIQPALYDLPADSTDEPSKLYIDDFSVAPAYYLGEAELAAEKLAAKADAINYIEKMSEYFTDEQVNAWKEEVNGTESIIDTKSSKVSVHHGLVTVKQEINAELQDNLLAHIAEKTGVAYDKNGNNDELKAKYTPENWLEIESAVQAALDKLTSQRIVNNDDGQSSVLAVKEVYAAAIDKLDSIRTILRAAQDDAIEKLNTYNVRDLYRDAEWEQVQAIIAEYTAKINAATKVDYTPQTQQPDPEEGDPTEGGNTEGNGEGEAQPAADQSAEEETPSEGGEEGSGEEGDDPAVDPEAELGVKQLLVIAVGKLNAVKTKAMYEQEETEAAKESAKAELEAYKNADDYRAAQKEALADEVEAGKTAIENASDVAGVQAALGAAKTAIDGIKTDAQLSAEEQAAAALASAKQNAKAELETYKNADDYRAAQKEALAAAVEAGKTAIENASDVAGVQAALGAAKTAIDGIKTDAQLSAEENEGDGEGKKSGCNSDIFADASVWLALVLLLAGAGIAFAKKRQN